VSFNSCSLKPNVRTSKPAWPAVPAVTNAPESLLSLVDWLGSNPLSVCAGTEWGPAWICPWTECKDVSPFE